MNDMPCMCGLLLSTHSRYGKSTFLYKNFDEQNNIEYMYFCEEFVSDNLKYMEALYE